MPHGKRVDGAPDLKMSQHPTALTIKKSIRVFGYYSYIVFIGQGPLPV
jgi:hypothetical protein